MDHSVYSRMNAQFNREALRDLLKATNIAYVFLGRELGARSEDPECYVQGRVQYDRLARAALFQQGLTRVLQGREQHRIALLCAEKDPLTCHRGILVSRELAARGVDVEHSCGREAGAPSGCTYSAHGRGRGPGPRSACG